MKWYRIYLHIVRKENSTPPTAVLVPWLSFPLDFNWLHWLNSWQPAGYEPWSINNRVKLTNRVLIEGFVPILGNTLIIAIFLPRPGLGSGLGMNMSGTSEEVI
jgi:hypothetical protein